MKKIAITTLLLLTACIGFAQKTVTTGNQKYVLIEEATGAWCQFCPDGAVVLEDIAGSNNKVIPVSIHDNDAMDIPDGNTVINTYAPGFPCGGVDRVASGGGVFVDRSAWQGKTTAQLAVAADFSVKLDHGYDDATKTLTIKVTATALKALTGSFNINAYIIEDSVTGTGSGYNQVNYFNSVTGHKYYGAGNPIIGFIHRHVLRAMLGGSWGTTGVITDNPAANAGFSKTYTYTIPASANYKRFHIVALVQKKSTNENQRDILNSISAKVVPGVLGVGNIIEAMDNISIYPNPAHSNVAINGSLKKPGEIKISIMNAMGQLMIEKNYTTTTTTLSENINLDQLTNGVYFISVTAGDNAKTVRKLIVNN